LAIFIVSPTVQELLSPPRVDKDSTLCIWAYSERRRHGKTARAFLNAVYDNRHSSAHPMYYLQRVVYSAIVACFVNHLDARLLYGCGYHCGYEMLILNRTNIFTTEDFFPMGR
jgi:hypothetical protein